MVHYRIQSLRAEQSRAEQTCIDGTINKPQKREIANCITARYDCGISNQQQTGIVVAESR